MNQPTNAKVQLEMLQNICRFVAQLVLLAIDNAFARVVNRSKSLVLYAGAIISLRLIFFSTMLPKTGPPDTRTSWKDPQSNWPTRHDANPKITSMTTSTGGEDVSGKSAAMASDR